MLHGSRLAKSVARVPRTLRRTRLGRAPSRESTRRRDSQMPHARVHIVEERFSPAIDSAINCRLEKSVAALKRLANEK
jgi:hypothetical protein